MKKLLSTAVFTLIALGLYAQKTDEAAIERFLQIAERKATTPDQDMIEDWERAKAYTKEYLDAMPEDSYSFKPTPEIRSFAQQYLHTAAVNYRYVTFATGQPNPYPGDDLETVKEMQSKAAVTKVTMESYDAVINALKNLTGVQAKEKATYYRWTTTKEMIFRKGLEHLSHHRGQTTIYIRLKGVVPPGENLLNATERMNMVEEKR